MNWCLCGLSKYKRWFFLSIFFSFWNCGYGVCVEWVIFDWYAIYRVCGRRCTALAVAPKIKTTKFNENKNSRKYSKINDVDEIVSCVKPVIVINKIPVANWNMRARVVCTASFFFLFQYYKERNRQFFLSFFVCIRTSFCSSTRLFFSLVIFSIDFFLFSLYDRSFIDSVLILCTWKKIHRAIELDLFFSLLSHFISLNYYNGKTHFIHNASREKMVQNISFRLIPL